MEKHHYFGLGVLLVICLLLFVAWKTLGLGNALSDAGKILKNSFTYTSSSTTQTTAPKATSTVFPIPAPGGKSLLYRKIRIDALSLGNTGQNQLLVLKSYAKTGEKIAISGWRLEMGSSTEYIPKIPDVYLTSGSEAPTDIVMNRPDIFILFSTLSPVKENIRINKCMGYVERKYTFVPPIGAGCPVPKPQDLAGLRGECRAYIASIPLCEEHLLTLTPPSGDSQCSNFIDRFNYDGCVRAYRNDQDFLFGEWGEWIGVPFIKTTHGTITLKDKEGRLVDTYTY